MRYRYFPGLDVPVSEVGFGAWTLATGWWGEKTDEEAVGMLRSAHSRFGINFFDAADSYGNGRSERQLADAFRGKRDQVVYGTKIGYDIYDESAQKARRGASLTHRECSKGSTPGTRCSPRTIIAGTVRGRGW